MANNIATCLPRASDCRTGPDPTCARGASTTLDAGPTASELLEAAKVHTCHADRRKHHPVLFDRTVWRLVKEGFEGPLAVRAVNEAWAFLGLCVDSAVPLSPTPIVDAAWHATILHTRQYAELCQNLGASGLIHHEPFDHPSQQDRGGLGATIHAFRASGIPYDPEFWEMTGSLMGKACDGQECMVDTCTGTCKCTPRPPY
ncbi:MAG: hypothetical protein F4X38_00800 [Acidimicrobiaceae bacterium]|nr:hypothetical protein [Acidimicrobiaceae bacterium]